MKAVLNPRFPSLLSSVVSASSYLQYFQKSICIRLTGCIFRALSIRLIRFPVFPEEPVQPVELSLLQFLRHIRIDVHRRLNILMPKGILDHLHINAGFNHPRCERMPEIVTAEVRKQNLRILVLQELCVVAVPNDPAERLIQSALMLGFSKAVS